MEKGGEKFNVKARAAKLPAGRGVAVTRPRTALHFHCLQKYLNRLDVVTEKIFRDLAACLVSYPAGVVRFASSGLADAKEVEKMIANLCHAMNARKRPASAGLLRRHG